MLKVWQLCQDRREKAVRLKPLQMVSVCCRIHCGDNRISMACWKVCKHTVSRAKMNPDRIDGIAQISGFMYPYSPHIYRLTAAFQNTWTIFLLCFSTVTLLFVTLSTRGYLCHVLQRWFIRMPLCKRLHRRILWKRWIVWHGFVTDIHPTTLNTIILKWLI